MNRVLSCLFWLAIGLVLAFITLPLAVVVAASLSPSSTVTFLPWDWTLDWYGALLTDRWLQPFLLSVRMVSTASAMKVLRLSKISPVPTGALPAFARWCAAYQLPTCQRMNMPMPDAIAKRLRLHCPLPMTKNAVSNGPVAEPALPPT